jgi:hypothetical protein
MPKEFESLDLTGYDLVISSCSSCSKGVITPVNAPHICYCHTPTRYIWTCTTSTAPTRMVETEVDARHGAPYAALGQSGRGPR